MSAASDKDLKRIADALEDLVRLLELQMLQRDAAKAVRYRAMLEFLSGEGK